MQSNAKLLLGVFIAIFSIEYDHCLPSNFRGYKLYDIEVKSTEKAHFMRSKIAASGYDQLFASKDFSKPWKVIVPPNEQKLFESELRRNSIHFRVEALDLQEYVSNVLRKSKNSKDLHGSVSFDKFLSYEEINAYLKKLAKDFPEIAKVEVKGKSYEGRPILGIHISYKPVPQKVILITGGIHSREWASPACALYIIYQLVEKSKEMDDFLKNFDWIILPMTNPDGYIYSLTTDPFWRKTRSPQGNDCFGVDVNRNFPFHWSEEGASDSPCSSQYRGKRALSETETQTVRKLLMSAKGRCSFYLDIHSRAECILIPWAYTTQHIPKYDSVKEVALAGAKAILNATSTEFKVGSAANILYIASGSSIDYAMGIEKVPFAVGMELSGPGFHPPPEKIKSIVIEGWVGLKAMVAQHEQVQIATLNMGLVSESVLHQNFLLIYVFKWSISRFSEFE
ncbi:zinc carboxypeptidase-like [Hermetia illucens]|uniref:zinc carboxypeptidase-like n=1 Tax=Hermetia illucens TaxID=343691 RepID=UPI0018CC5F52|nr:zinc carboxypeptidase-like [Hermetia illucens]